VSASAISASRGSTGRVEQSDPGLAPQDARTDP